jgi:replicative DNA helicase
MAGERKRNTKSDLDQINAQYGKIPPQAIEVEEAVLGALMLEREAFVGVADVLIEESFYKEEHRTIFKVIKELSMQDKAVDLLIITQELKNRGLLEQVGGPVYVTQLTSKVASAAHLEFHARIIAQKYIQRELIRACSEIQSNAFDETKDVDELINQAESAIFKISEGNIKKETQPIKPILKEAVNLIQEASKRDDGLSGVPSGFTGVDRVTSGWQKTDLIIIAARPAMGKTAFILSMTRNMAVRFKVPVAVFSLEMSSIQLVNRLISAESELGSEKIKKGTLIGDDWSRLNSAIQVLDEAPIFIDDTPALSIFEFRAKCRRLKMQHDIGMVLVDYLQLMTAGTDTRGSREQEVSLISRSLKAIAKELNVPIIALSQLNRSVESREGKRPQLSDLRESGAIEQDADMVIFIHRPEYYGLTEDEEGNSLRGIAEIIIAKHRNGAVEDVKLAFRKELARFSDIEHYPTDFDAGGIQTFKSKMNEDPGGRPGFSQPFDMAGGSLAPNTNFSAHPDDPPF